MENRFTEKYIKPGTQLFQNQKDNVKRLVHKRRCILSDKCGGGKSMSVLYAFSYLKEKALMKNLLVLTPLSAYEKEVWKKDMQKFTTFTYIDIKDLLKLYKSNRNKLSQILDKYDVIYGKHTNVKQEEFRSLIVELASLSTTLFCVDEVHAFRNPKSAMTLQLRDITKNVRAFWAITATTISRNIENLYNIVNLVYPWYLGPWTMFRDTYCNTMLRTIGYDPVTHRKKQACEVTTLKDPEGLRQKLEPIMITGESFFDVKYQFLDYELDAYEQDIYTKITQGIAVDVDKDPEEWFKWLMSNDNTKSVAKIGDVDKYSSRFIYLQHAADGIIASDGTYTRKNSVKMKLLVNKLKEITSKGQSALVYFDYLASVEMAKIMLEQNLNGVVILLSTGDNKLKEGTLTEARCKMKPHIVLCSRAASESASYYFINNVIFFHSPTVPSTFIQMLGRITRKNSLFPDDLNCYIFRSNNIDLYKLLIVSGKTYLMEQASGEHEANVPDLYKEQMSKAAAQARYRRILLWQE